MGLRVDKMMMRTDRAKDPKQVLISPVCRVKSSSCCEQQQSSPACPPGPIFCYQDRSVRCEAIIFCLPFTSSGELRWCLGGLKYPNVEEKFREVLFFRLG